MKLDASATDADSIRWRLAGGTADLYDVADGGKTTGAVEPVGWATFNRITSVPAGTVGVVPWVTVTSETVTVVSVAPPVLEVVRAMISLMALILLIGLTGYWSVKEFLGDILSGAHETISNIALVIVVIHIAAAIIMSFMQKENLIRSMVTGKKQGSSEQAIRYPMYLVGTGLAIAWAYSFYLVVSGALPALTQ
jgi:hypothetical protein